MLWCPGWAGAPPDRPQLLAGLFYSPTTAPPSQVDRFTAEGRRLLRLESENARSGLPPGLALQQAQRAPMALSRPLTVLRAAATHAGCCTALRGAAAAAAAEAAEERQRAGARGWLARLLPGGARGGGSDGDEGDGQSMAQAPRSRLHGLVSGAMPAGGGGDRTCCWAHPCPAASLQAPAPAPAAALPAARSCLAAGRRLAGAHCTD